MYINIIDIIPDRVYNRVMNKIAEFIKQKRKEAGLTQEDFAIRSGLGLRFVRELEQGKETVRMDKVNQALSMFGMEAVPGRKDD
ncbi:helix-turn-helix transcriptional regulator [Oscillospiraceae bacterium LCP25S3_E3]